MGNTCVGEVSFEKGCVIAWVNCYNAICTYFTPTVGFIILLALFDCMAEILRVEREMRGLHRLLGSSEEVIAAAISKSRPYVEAREEAETLAQQYGLKVADLPLLITAMSLGPHVQKAIRARTIDTLTHEVSGTRGDERFYEVWHSVGSLATVIGLRNAFAEDRPNLGAVSRREWAFAGDGRNVQRIHIDDIRRGQAPVAGHPYIVFARLNKDQLDLSSGYLNKGEWMQNDVVLARCGSLENRERLVSILFGPSHRGGENKWEMESVHGGLHEGDFSNSRKCVRLFKQREPGLCSTNNLIGDYGRFAAVIYEGEEQQTVGGELSLTLEEQGGDLSLVPEGGELSLKERAS